MVNSYLLLFRNLGLSLNLKLDFSGELMLFSAFLHFLFCVTEGETCSWPSRLFVAHEEKVLVQFSAIQ